MNAATEVYKKSVCDAVWVNIGLHKLKASTNLSMYQQNA